MTVAGIFYVIAGIFMWAEQSVALYRFWMLMLVASQSATNWLQI